MSMRIMINGREVTNPAARALAGTIVFLMVMLLLSLFVFVALPLLGVALGAALGSLAVGAGSLLLGVPLARRRLRRGAADRAGEDLTEGRSAVEIGERRPPLGDGK